MRKLIILAVFFVTNLTLSQNYEYIIVKSKFDFVQSIDGYSTSSLTKFLLQKKGLKVFLDNEELPQEIYTNRCLAMYADVKDNSGMLSTKTSIEIRDCKNNLLIASKEGGSRLKMLKRAYQKSIRDAYNSLGDLQVPMQKKVKTKIVSQVRSEKNKNLTLETYNAFKVGDDYYLFDKDKQLKFKISPTDSPEKFLIIGKNGSVTKKEGFWLVRYSLKDKDITKKIRIKF